MFGNARDIGLDLDEVLANFLDTFLIFYNGKHKTRFRRDDFKSYVFCDTIGGTLESDIEELEEFYDTMLFRYMKSVEDSKGGIAYLFGRSNLHIITSRRESLREKTQDWVERTFGYKFSSINLTGDSNPSNSSSKSEQCKKLGLDVIIEDNTRYAEDCANADIPVILLDCPWNQCYEREGVVRVKNWFEILEYFK